MRYLFFSFFILSACAFHPLYTNTKRQQVCVNPIANEGGYYMYQQLKDHFPQKSDCMYTLTVDAPQYAFSDQSISDKDFITMQHIDATTSYTLKDQTGNIVLKNNVSASGSSAVTSNPYATVTASQKTSNDLLSLLTDQIVLHVSAFLDEDNQ